MKRRYVSISTCSSPWPTHLQHPPSLPPIAAASHISLIFQDGDFLISPQLHASALCLTSSYLELPKRTLTLIIFKKLFQSGLKRSGLDWMWFLNFFLNLRFTDLKKNQQTFLLVPLKNKNPKQDLTSIVMQMSSEFVVPWRNWHLKLLWDWPRKKKILMQMLIEVDIVYLTWSCDLSNMISNNNP